MKLSASSRPRVGERRFDRLRDLAAVEPVALDRVPGGGRVARHHVLVARQIGRAVDGDAVVVPKDDEPSELQVPGKPDSLVIDALHEVAIAGNDVGAMVDEVVAVDRIEVPLGNGHPNGHCEALPKRSGRDFNAGKLKILGVPRARRAELPETLDVVDCRLLVAGEVEQSVDQHRPMAGGQDEAVAIGPVRVLRIELQMACEQGGGRVRHAHRHSRMAAVGGFHGVHRQGADGVGKSALGRLHRGSAGGV